MRRALVPVLAFTFIFSMATTASPRAVSHREIAALHPVTALRHFEPVDADQGNSSRFVMRAGSYAALVSSSGFRVSLADPDGGRVEVGVELIGADPGTPEVRVDALRSRSHYLRGRDPKRWRRAVPHYARVQFEEVYPGIDLAYYTREDRLEYDFIVAPGTDPASIRLAVTGAEDVRIDDSGSLVFETKAGDITQRMPTIYQVADGARQIVRGGFEIDAEGGVGFRIQDFDRGVSLIIDPALEYSTYLGGLGNEDAVAIARDASGNLYIAGYVTSANFPTVDPLQSTIGGEDDVMIAKIATDGSFAFATYLGGAGDDQGSGIAVDSSGYIYVTGSTYSTDFPTAPSPCTPAVNCPVQTSSGGGEDAFVAKLVADGSSLVYSTYLGGSSDENNILRSGDIAADDDGYAYVTGETQSTDFPTTNGAYQEAYAGDRDVFVTKLNPGGTSPVFSTYVGTTTLDSTKSIAIDDSGNIFVGGRYGSTGNPWIFKMNAAGSALLYDTTILSSGHDEVTDIVIDSDGAVYVVGTTQSTSFPVVNAFQESFGGGTTDAFFAKLDATGSELLFASYLGGEDIDRGSGIDVDSDGKVVIAGSTYSSDFPTKQAYEATHGGSSDVFVAMLHPSGSRLLYSTYLGTSGTESARAVVLGSEDRAHLTGFVQSSEFPTVDAPQPTYGLIADAFVATFVPEPGSISMALVALVVIGLLRRGRCRPQRY
jgi:hypothetical protein